MPDEEYLLNFYGTECVSCREMEPLVEKLEKELTVKLKRIEVWHNSQNAAYLEKLDMNRCGSVPYFHNLKTGKWLCGKVDYETLKKWALGQ